MNYITSSVKQLKFTWRPISPDAKKRFQVRKKKKYLEHIIWLIIASLGVGWVHAQSLVDKVNVMIGTTGPIDTEYGGLTPAVAPPFAVTQRCV